MSCFTARALAEVVTVVTSKRGSLTGESERRIQTNPQFRQPSPSTGPVPGTALPVRALRHQQPLILQPTYPLPYGRSSVRSRLARSSAC